MMWDRYAATVARIRKNRANSANKLRTMARSGTFEFAPFSAKQKKVLNWWCPNSPVKHYNGIIADGSIRSGKTLSMSLAFVIWAMASFDMRFFGMCGKTIGSLRRNVIFWLKIMLRTRGYTVKDRRSDNLLIVSRGETINYFYLFGGKDERSQDLVQGVTLAGAFFDEVALMPESFVNQATARCSVAGSKWWFNCNPQGPQHWFYTKWIKKCKKLGLLYLHFTMDDNLSLDEDIKQRYRLQYVGVFFLRYIMGMWVAAEGAIYTPFVGNEEKYLIKTKADGWRQALDYDFIQIGVDFGGNKSAYAFVATGIKWDNSKLTALMSERHPAKGVTPAQMDKLLQAFIAKVEAKYCYKNEIFKMRADCAEQALINGIKSWCTYLVKDSVKKPIIDRIRATTSLMSQGRFFYTDDCKTLADAFCAAVYNEKKLDDERLDDGTSDIDTLDAFEYSWEEYLRSYMYV